MMTSEATRSDSVHVQHAPHIDGLTFRSFRGETDLPEMLEVARAGNLTDQLETTPTIESLRESITNLSHSDPCRDIVIVEVADQVIGYKRVLWWPEQGGTTVYGHVGYVLPQWREQGIGTAMLRHSEQRLRDIAAEHPQDGEKEFSVYTSSTQPGLERLLQQEGYKPVRNFHDMVNTRLAEVQEIALPQGIEVRPVQPEQMRAIWEAEVEAVADDWGWKEPEEGDYERWLHTPVIYFQPRLWQVAWDEEQVAGLIRNYINPEYNTQHGKQRAYTEDLSVRRPWRRRGLARALVARSLRSMHEAGMSEATCTVDSESATGAMQLALSLGFQVHKRTSNYRKPLL